MKKVYYKIDTCAIEKSHYPILKFIYSEKKIVFQQKCDLIKIIFGLVFS